MLDWILGMMLGVDLEKSKKPKKPTRNEAKEGIIRPFPDAPVRIDFFTNKIYGRCTPEYAAVPYGRMFTRGEERVLAKAMVDACVSFYGERMDKNTLDGFRNYIIRKCKVTSQQEYQGIPSSYGTPEKQMNAINRYVERKFGGRELRETPTDRYFKAYRDLQEIRRISDIYESRRATEKILKAMDEEEKKRQEYQKYRNIWY